MGLALQTEMSRVKPGKFLPTQSKDGKNQSYLDP